MSVDDFVKIILAVSVAFAIAGISFQIMRLLDKMTDLLKEASNPVKNISTLSDYLLEDYNEIRKVLRSTLNAIGSAGELFSSLKALSLFKGFIKKKSSSKENTEE